MAGTRDRTSIIGTSAVVGSLVLASILGITLNLALPFVLPIEEYARYSLLLGFGQLVASVAFEWVRIGVLRYAYADENQSALRRSLLALAYLVVFGLLATAALVWLAMVAASPWFVAAAIICTYAGFQGLFEGQQALARARFDNRTFSARATMRAILGLVLALAGASMFGTAEAAIIGLALAFPLAAVPGRTQLPAVRLPTSLWRGELLFLLRFGGLAAASTSLSLAAPAMVKTAAVSMLGLEDAGGFLLAVDLTQRLFSTLGSAVNSVAFQNAVQAVESGHRGSVSRGLRYQMLAVASLALPAAIVFGTFADWVAVLLVPASYRDSFVIGAAGAAATLGLMSIRQYSLDPVFLLFRAPARAIVGPAVTVVALLLLAAMPIEFGTDAQEGLNVTLVLASALGLGVAASFMAGLSGVVWPSTDLLRLLAVTTTMLLVAVLIPSGVNLIFAVGKLTGLLVIFAGGALWLNVLGVRTAVWGLREGKA